MRDERVVYDRLQRDRQRRMLERRGEIPAQGTASTAESNFFSPFELTGSAGADISSTLGVDRHLEHAEPMTVGMLGHNGYRSVARNSKRSYRGFIIVNGHEVQHESGIERNTVLIMLTWHDVVDIYSQRPKVRYPDAEGEWHDYIYDYLVILKDGTRLALSVKPERVRADEEATLAQIVSVPQPDFDTTSVFTDRTATRAAAFNARLILWAREEVTEHAVQAAREVMWLSKGEFFFWQLFDGGVPHHLRRAAIVRLIDLGEIVPKKPLARITDHSLLMKRMTDNHLAERPQQRRRPSLA